MNRRNHQRRFPNYLSTIGINLTEIEWRAEKISNRERKRLLAKANKIGKIILADWLADAKASLAATAKLVDADREWLAREAEREAERAAAERDLADTTVIIDRLVEADLPALRAAADRLRKQRRAMSKAVKRERQRLEAAGRKLAGAKLQAFRRGRKAR
jgi:hypothetical protein